MADIEIVEIEEILIDLENPEKKQGQRKQMRLSRKIGAIFAFILTNCLLALFWTHGNAWRLVGLIGFMAMWRFWIKEII